MALHTLLLLMSALLSLVIHVNSVNEGNVDRQWREFKQMYNKKYLTDSEEMHRRNAWLDNQKFIDEHNADYWKGKESYDLRMNQFGDLTYREFQLVHLEGKKLETIRDKRSAAHYEHTNANALPASINWTREGFVTPVKNQGECGSCWAFSAIGAMEGQYFRKNKVLVVLSEQQLVDCDYRNGNNGCNGGWALEAFDYIREKGIQRQDSYPYTAEDGICQESKGIAVVRATGYQMIPRNDEEALRMAVATIGPISVSIDAGQSKFRFYSHGVYNQTTCSTTHLNHVVLVTGYGMHDGKAYWLVKNSWGTTWGDQGYVMMSRNSNNQCGIASDGVYPLV